MSDEERVKASVTDAPRVNNAIKTQVSLEENPFREGGEISKDAEEIVDAFKQGKLSVLSNPPPLSELSSASSPQPPSNLSPASPTKSGDNDIKDSVARDRKNGTYSKEKPGIVEVQHGVVNKGDCCDVEKIVLPKKEKKCGCCVLL